MCGGRGVPSILSFSGIGLWHVSFPAVLGSSQLLGLLPGAQGPQTPVLILTTFDLDDYVFGALEAGAAGFLLKDADPEVIVDAVRSVAAGQGTLLPKFGVRSRLQAVVWAYQNRVVAVPDG